MSVESQITNDFGSQLILLSPEGNGVTQPYAPLKSLVMVFIPLSSFRTGIYEKLG